jgi:hypothetical protein
MNICVIRDVKGDWQLLRIIPMGLVMGMIFYLSHQEGSTLSLPAIPYIDKLGHFILYSILAATALYALPVSLRYRYPQRSVIAIILFCLFYGITDELHQAFIPDRDACLGDLIADVLGAALTVLLWYRQQSSETSRRAQPGLSEGLSPGKSSGIQ